MIYQSIYDLIMSVIFDGATSLAWADLVCTVVSTLAVLLILALPFMIVWKVIKTVLGG